MAGSCSASLLIDNFIKAKVKLNGEERKGKEYKNFCFYCEMSVLNFVRRMHTIEIEVQKIVTLSTESKERKHLLTLLRNCLVSSVQTKAMTNQFSMTVCCHVLIVHDKTRHWPAERTRTSS